MIDPELLNVFESHATKVREAARAKRDAVALKHVVDDPELRDEAIDDNTLGKRLPGERFAGDTALRTLNQLLAMVDQRGFERSAHQIRFHSSMIRCVVRVLYRADWATQAPVIMQRNGWDRCPSEVLVSTPRRFGKVRPLAQLERTWPAAQVGCTCAGGRPLASPSCRRASRSPAAARLSSSRPRGAPAAKFWSACTSFFACSTRASGSPSTTRRSAASTATTAARRSSAPFRRPSGCAATASR